MRRDSKVEFYYNLAWEMGKIIFENPQTQVYIGTNIVLLLSPAFPSHCYEYLFLAVAVSGQGTPIVHYQIFGWTLVFWSRLVVDFAYFCRFLFWIHQDKVYLFAFPQAKEFYFTLNKMKVKILIKWTVALVLRISVAPYSYIDCFHAVSNPCSRSVM